MSLAATMSCSRLQFLKIPKQTRMSRRRTRPAVVVVEEEVVVVEVEVAALGAEAPARLLLWPRKVQAANKSVLEQMRTRNPRLLRQRGAC